MSVHDCFCFCGFVLLVFGGIAGLIYVVQREGEEVSREAVCEIINDIRDCISVEGYCAILERMKKLPSVKQEQKWIPVSERLPENKETVLVTFEHFVSGNTIGLGSVILLRGKPHWHVREQNLGTYDVIAWMPLPKPYEPQERSE